MMFSVVIQAGGKSNRMGRDKALLPFPDKPLIQHLTLRFSSITDDLITISPNVEQLDFLQVPVYPDLIPDNGPLVGLLTGLHYAQHERVAMIACDMPFASLALTQQQIALMVEYGSDVVIPVVDGKMEPLHALYRREPCLQAIKNGLNAGMRRLVEWHAAVKVHEMGEAEIRKTDPDLLAFFNINTPEDYTRALEILRQRDETRQVESKKTSG